LDELYGNCRFSRDTENGPFNDIGVSNRWKTHANKRVASKTMVGVESDNTATQFNCGKLCRSRFDDRLLPATSLRVAAEF
jgi:hypothetical protein